MSMWHKKKKNGKRGQPGEMGCNGRDGEMGPPGKDSPHYTEFCIMYKLLMTSVVTLAAVAGLQTVAIVVLYDQIGGL